MRREKMTPEKRKGEVRGLEGVLNTYLLQTRQEMAY